MYIVLWKTNVMPDPLKQVCSWIIYVWATVKIIIIYEDSKEIFFIAEGECMIKEFTKLRVFYYQTRSVLQYHCHQLYHKKKSSSSSSE